MECDTLRLEIPSKCVPLQKGSSGSPSHPPLPPRSTSCPEKSCGSSKALSRLLYPVITAEGSSSAGCSGMPSTSLGNQNNAEQYRSTEHPTGLVNNLLPKRTRSVPSFTKVRAESAPLARSTSSKGIKKQQVALTPKVSRSTSFPLLREMQPMRRQSSLRTREVLVLHSANAKDRLVRASPGLQEVCDRTHPELYSDDEREVAKEEAVCRICMLELHEGGETLKMECSCKGDLALAHQDCVVKWFRIRGNPLCDVCGSEVRNLPVILFRRQSSVHLEEDIDLDEQNNEDSSSWHHLAVMILSSALTSLWNKLEELSEFP